MHVIKILLLIFPLGLFFVNGLSQPNLINDPNVLPIDGVWEEQAIVLGNRVSNGNFMKISNRKVFIEKQNSISGLFFRKGAIAVRSIREMNKNWFQGVVANKPNVKVDFIWKDDELHFVIDREKEFGVLYYTHRILINPQLEHEDLYNYYYHNGLYQNQVALMNEIRVVSETQTQRISKGVTMSIEKSHTIRKELSFSNNYNQLKGKGSAYQISQFGLGRATEKWVVEEIESTLGERVEQEETNKVTVTLDGNVATTWKLVWYNRVKLGKVEFQDARGQKKYLYFKIPLTSELEVVPVDGF